MYNRDNSAKGARGCGVCLCMAFGLALFATVSPYWLWNVSWSWSGWGSSSVATGAYVVSSSSASLPCGWGGWSTCTVRNQWNHFSTFNDTVCSDTTMYNNVGKYGFCTAQNGSFQTPSAVKQIQALSVTATVLFFVSSIGALVSPGRGCLGFFSGSIALVGCACSIAAFAIACGFDYYKSFGGAGGYLLYLSNDIYNVCNGNCAVLSYQVNLSWGPAFWAMILAFVISLVGGVAILVASPRLDDDLEGDYGSGNEYKPAAEDYGYGAPMQA